MDGNSKVILRVPLNLREASERYGITPRALRHYESLELLAPLRDGRNRIYDARQQVRIELLLQGRAYRLKLEEIRQIINLYHSDGPEVQAERWRDVLRRQSRHLRAERIRLDRAIDRIEEEAGSA